ncbi:MAG: 3-hydroxyacyl-ACP dehydratase FabZ [Thermodesulfobacteriota bacterium]
MDRAKTLDIDELLKIMAHRYPFLMIDKVIEIEKGVRIKALKNVSYNEPYFQGHFPDKPVMPGVLIVEAMAQAGVVLINFSSDNNDEFFYLGGIDKARFRKPVRPGDQLIIEMSIVRKRAKVHIVSGECSVSGEKVAEGQFMAVMEKGTI